MYCRDELCLHSPECYFGVYFPRCFASREINTWTVRHSSTYIILYIFVNHVISGLLIIKLLTPFLAHTGRNIIFDYLDSKQQNNYAIFSGNLCCPWKSGLIGIVSFVILEKQWIITSMLISSNIFINTYSKFPWGISCLTRDKLVLPVVLMLYKN